MKIVNIHEAKTHLSRLIEEAVQGEAFIIARAGRPLVKVEPLGGDTRRRTGFLQGQIDIPSDFDTMCAEEIEAMFEGRAVTPNKTSR